LSSSHVNIQESVRARLLKLSLTNREDYNLTLLRYLAERFLYRLGRSKYHDTFVLKGAYLLSVTLGRHPFRATKDIDFLKTGNSKPEFLKNAITQICSIQDPDDGIIFDTPSMKMTEIQESQRYRGQRIKLPAYIGTAHISLQIDIGTGDVICPGTTLLTIPTLLDHKAPQVSAYPIEAVIAEKIEAIVSIGMITSRMKDFFDLYTITTSISLNYSEVREAVLATFERRQTEIPEVIPPVLTEVMAEDLTKQTQWTAFIQRVRSDGGHVPLADVLSHIREFVSPIFGMNKVEDDAIWQPDGGWQII